MISCQPLKQEQLETPDGLRPDVIIFDECFFGLESSDYSEKTFEKKKNSC